MMEHKELIDQLYDVLYWTENEAAFELISNTIDYVKGAAFNG